MLGRGAKGDTDQNVLRTTASMPRFVFGFRARAEFCADSQSTCSAAYAIVPEESGGLKDDDETRKPKNPRPN